MSHATDSVTGCPLTVSVNGNRLVWHRLKTWRQTKGNPERNCEKKDCWTWLLNKEDALAIVSVGS